MTVGLLAALAVLLALLPAWFPCVLKPALGHLGIAAEEVRRVGYNRLLLRGVRWTEDGMDLRAQGIRLPQPTAWLWHRCFGASAHDALIGVVGAEVTLSPAGTETAPASPPAPSLAARLDQTAEVFLALKQWLPSLDWRDGKVAIAGQEVSVPELRWRDGRIAATVQTAAPALAIEVTIESVSAQHFSLRAREFRQSAEVTAELRAEDSAWALTLAGDWRGNPFEGRATMARETVEPWPDTLELLVPQLRWPTELPGLPHYSNLVGQVRVTGHRDTFELRASATAEPNDARWPHAAAEVAATLSPAHFSLARLEVRSAPLTAVLSNPVTWQWQTRHVDRPARLAVKMDLGAQSWLDARGSAEGEVLVTPDEVWSPHTAFRFTGRQLEGFGASLSELDLSGRAKGLVIEAVEVAACSTDGASGELHARGLDFDRRILERAELAVQLSSGFLLARRWPAEFDTATVTASLNGHWTNLQHRGIVAVNRLLLPGLKPGQASVAWEGEQLQRIASQGTFTTTNGEVTLAGTLESLADVTLSTCQVRAFAEAPLELVAPARLSLRPIPNANSSTWSLGAFEVALANPTRQITLSGEAEWPQRARGVISVTNLDTRFLAAFLATELPTAGVGSLAAELNGGRDPARVSLTGEGWWEAAPQRPVRVALRLASDHLGVRIHDLRVREGEREALRLTGRLPLYGGSFTGGPLWEVRPDQPLGLDFTLTPTSTLQRRGLERMGFTAANLRGNGSFSGTLARLTGRVQLRADQIEPTPPSPWVGRLPRLTDLELTVLADTNHLRLDSWRLRVDGTPVRATATLPLTTDFWAAALRGEFAPNLTRLSAEASVRRLPLSGWITQWVSLLRPEGEVSAEVRLQPELRWSGKVEFGGISTQPLPVAGSLRNVQGRLSLEDRRVRAESVTVDVGGTPAFLEGWLELPSGAATLGLLPAAELRLVGTNLALLRQANLIVRGDLNLLLRHAPTNAPVVEGSVTLGRSFVLSDLQAALAGNVRGAEGPLSLFRVEEPLLADWRLRVDLRGDECLHVRSPFYTGVHSVNLRLRGTLREPLLLGDAQVVRGDLLFPYTTLSVRQGLVSFTEANPGRPRLQAWAGGRAFGYDVRVEASGEAQAPVVRFSSSPPLSSESILLMITAGELPRQQRDTSTADRLSKLALLLGKDLMGKLGSPEPGEERLVFRSGERISTRGKVTRKLEYRLTPVWSLVGEYDEYDELNAGVKWRVLRR